ncbi:MAG TPA: 3' terminal RNA ribose 2'-O-methyltransferase Hen1 [Stellaceae bacterium]
MFLSIATTHRPATDLGFLLHKHPDRLHEAELPFGKAHLFYPEARHERCEAALVLDVDPIGLVRGRGAGVGAQDQYVNDRPYAASSFLSVALLRLLRSAMAGSSRERPELVEQNLPLEARVAPLPARDGGAALVRELFEPLGWTVEIEPIAGIGGSASPYVSLRLAGNERLAALLNHLYVLVPVLDDDKHYWVGDDEVAKLLQRGEGWLDRHPARELIVARYLRHQRSLSRAALARLAPDEADAEEIGSDVPEDRLEAPLRLSDQRLDAVVAALRGAGARSVADLGCGEGALLSRLSAERWADTLFGLDASAAALARAAQRLGPRAHRVSLLHGSLAYRDRRWEGAAAAALVEVVEHIDRDRLPAVERVVFGRARPATVVVTTPNRDYNVLFRTLPAGALRHPDHRFEWDRAEFRAWVASIEASHGYRAALSGIGPSHPEHGAPTQMAVFRR